MGIRYVVTIILDVESYISTTIVLQYWRIWRVVPCNIYFDSMSDASIVDWSCINWDSLHRHNHWWYWIAYRYNNRITVLVLLNRWTLSYVFWFNELCIHSWLVMYELGFITPSQSISILNLNVIIRFWILEVLYWPGWHSNSGGNMLYITCLNYARLEDN